MVEVFDDRRADRAREPDRIDAEMASEAAVLGGDDRRAHLRRNLLVGEPPAEARPERKQHLPVGGAHADHLTEVGPLGQLAVARQVGRRDADRDDQREDAQDGRIREALQHADH